MAGLEREFPGSKELFYILIASSGKAQPVPGFMSQLAMFQQAAKYKGYI